MKITRKVATSAAALAVRGLGSGLYAQQADSARADRPMPMMQCGGAAAGRAVEGHRPRM